MSEIGGGKLSGRWIAALVIVLGLACAREPSISDGPLVSEISRRGDTTVVRTVSGSVWERPARLVEELRIGDLEGGEETSFGEIRHAAVTPDGTIFIYDVQAPQIFRFDPSGELLSLVGREGEGPGEYSADVTGMVVDGDRLLVADSDNARLSAFSLQGDYIESLGAIYGLRSLVSPTLALSGEDIMVRVVMVAPQPGVPTPTPWPIGFERRRMDGTIRDTVPPQALSGEPADQLEAIPSGGVLVDSGSDFVFELRYGDGEIVRIDMPFERVEYTEGEVRAMGRMLAPVAAADGDTEASVASLKAPYLEYLFAADGRVSARRPVRDSDETTATWRAPRYQPSVLDVFERDGTYLGVIPLPPGSRPVVATETHLYVVELGRFDEQYLVRYRIEAL